MTPTPEFSRRVEIGRLSGRPVPRSISADAGERAALARRFDLLALNRLEAALELRRETDDTVRVTGLLTAEVAQACVVTLEPVVSAISESFTWRFAPSESESNLVLDPEAEVIEPIVDDAIDLGEAAAQQLALALDPYPRAPGARFDMSGG